MDLARVVSQASNQHVEDFDLVVGNDNFGHGIRGLLNKFFSYWIARGVGYAVLQANAVLLC